VSQQLGVNERELFCLGEVILDYEIDSQGGKELFSLLFSREFVVRVAWHAAKGTKIVFVFNDFPSASKMELAATLGAEVLLLGTLDSLLRG